MWTQLRKNNIMETFPCKYADKQSKIKINSKASTIQTPTMSSSKIKKKRKNQLQSSTQSIENSSEKKDP